MFLLLIGRNSESKYTIPREPQPELLATIISNWRGEKESPPELLARRVVQIRCVMLLYDRFLSANPNKASIPMPSSIRLEGSETDLIVSVAGIPLPSMLLK